MIKYIFKIERANKIGIWKNSIELIINLNDWFMLNLEAIFLREKALTGFIREFYSIRRVGLKGNPRICHPSALTNRCTMSGHNAFNVQSQFYLNVIYKLKITQRLDSLKQITTEFHSFEHKSNPVNISFPLSCLHSRALVHNWNCLRQFPQTFHFIWLIIFII